MAARATSRFQRHPAVRLVDSAYHEETDAELEKLKPEDVHWLYRIGLGPMLYAESRRAGLAWPADVDSFLRSADLSARVLYEQGANFLAEFLTRPDIPADRVTLLKGIALAERYYQPPHHRLMGDIDMLVDEGSVDVIANALAELGFMVDNLGLPSGFWADRHHLPPRRHPDSGIWVEIHTSLFDPASPVAEAEPFVASTVRGERQPVDFRGVSTRALSPELAMMHLIAHWAGDYRPVRAFSGLRDVAAMLIGGEQLDWDRILAWAETSDTLAKDLDLFLALLDDFGWCRKVMDLSVHRERLGNRIGGPARSMLKSSFWSMSLEGGSRWAGLGMRNTMTLWRVLLSERSPARALAALPWQILYPSDDPTRFHPGTQARRLRSLFFPDQTQG